MRKILVTGAAGFIGGNFVDYWHKKYPQDKIIGIDALTYASNANAVEYFNKNPYDLIQGDLTKDHEVRFFVDLLSKQALTPHYIFHFAAETHVCRSIEGPGKFVQTNIIGTFNLVEELRLGGYKGRLINILTDEIFGELGLEETAFTERTNLAPTSPYSASKAAQKLLADAYGHTYGLDVVSVAPSNNFGPRQHEEKLIPRTIGKILNNQPVTIFKPGTQVRDWLYVLDNCEAIENIALKGKTHELYCVGGDYELSLPAIIEEVYLSLERNTKKKFKRNVIMTDGRPTDDLRYALDITKVRNEIGWAPRVDRFKEYLDTTVKYYLEQK
jgi:dTDP-glucose 4,6-dehydratase